MKPSNAGRTLAKLRRREEVKCAVCGEVALCYVGASYCSARCRGTAAQRRRRARRAVKETRNGK